MFEELKSQFAIVIFKTKLFSSNFLLKILHIYYIYMYIYILDIGVYECGQKL